jgi:hypothetical protein
MPKRINIGDRVAYSANWLRSVGLYTGDLPAARGTVKALDQLGSTTLAVIDWGTDDIPRRVNVANLARVYGQGFSAM